MQYKLNKTDEKRDFVVKIMVSVGEIVSMEDIGNNCYLVNWGEKSERKEKEIFILAQRPIKNLAGLQLVRVVDKKEARYNSMEKIISDFLKSLSTAPRFIYAVDKEFYKNLPAEKRKELWLHLYTEQKSELAEKLIEKELSSTVDVAGSC